MNRLKTAKAVKNTKKVLKHRFWTEVVDGAKMFFLSGLLGGRYLKREMINLARFISVTKFRPLIWKNSHPFVVCDRFEDLTDPGLVHSNPKCDRTVSMYGYVRGTYLKPGQKMHILGLGDYDMKDLDLIPDPCPQHDQQKAKRRSLNDKEKTLYAPMTDLGGVSFDKDAMYVQIKRHQLNFSKPEDLLPDEKTRNQDDDDVEDPRLLQPSQGPGEEMIRNLQSLQTGLDERMESSSMRFFKNSAPVTRPALPEGEDEDEEVGEQTDVFERMQMLPVVDEQGRVRRKMVFDPNAPVEASGGDSDDSSSDDEDDSDSDAVARSVARKAARERKYRESDDEDDDDDESEEEEDQSEEDSEDVDMSADDEGNGRTDSGLQSGVWKDKLAARAQQSFNKRVNIMELVYGEDIKRASISAATVGGTKSKKKKKKSSILDNSDSASDSASSDDSDSDDDFFTKRGEGSKKKSTSSGGAGIGEEDEAEEVVVGHEDATMSFVGLEALQDWQDTEVCETIRNKFVTGDWDALPSSSGGNPGQSEGSENEDEDSPAEGEGSGDPMDLLNPDAHDHGISVEDDDEGRREGETVEEARERRAALKEQQKKGFDEKYDNEKGQDEGENDVFSQMQKTLEDRKQANQSEFADLDATTRFHIEGAVNGSYVRIVMSDIPCEFVQNFDPVHPLILGGLQASEQNLGFIQVRFKRHRWSKKILKSNNPLIVSLGWRRFQTMPIYSLEDNGRHRFLKYTPEHMHCLATFYGPISPPTTGSRQKQQQITP